jgi:hypothetical protein
MQTIYNLYFMLTIFKAIMPAPNATMSCLVVRVSSNIQVLGQHLQAHAIKTPSAKFRMEKARLLLRSEAGG